MSSSGGAPPPATLVNNDPVITPPVVNDGGKNNPPTSTSSPPQQDPSPPPPNLPSPTPPVSKNPVEKRPPITSLITTLSTSLSTSGTATFPVTVAVTRSTVIPAPGSNPNSSNTGQSNLLTPVFWSVTAATIGAIALCAGAICFLRARVRNNRNERVYRASRNATFNSNRTFQPGMTSNNQTSAFNNNPTKSAGYAGNVVTLVELVDSNKGSSTHSRSPPPPPMMQQQPIYAPQPTYAMPAQMTGYSQMGGNGGGPHDPYGGYALPQQQPMYTGSNGYGINYHQDEGEGVIHFAPTVNRDNNFDEFPDLPPPPPGMAYRTNDISMQPELIYVSEPQMDPTQYAHHATNDGGPPHDGNAAGVTRRLALP